ncbi:sulfotransferase domain-containing protein [Anaerobacillus alkalilacustris]|nr:sulfotransferase domain-containing protein [Anaerobacillus alkalilacustris]
MKSIYSFKHPKHYLFKYEELVNNPVATLTKLFNFIGVPFEDSILLNYDKHSNARDFTSEKLLPYKPIEKIQNTWVERWKDPIHEEIVASFKNKRKRCIGFEIPDIQ